jgi:glutaredoxin
MASNTGIHVKRLIGAVMLATGLFPLSSQSQPGQQQGQQQGRQQSAQQGATGTPPPASTAALPFELRTVAARYPVTLYATRSCAACDAGRSLLRQRGIPYAERLVTDGDAETLQRLTGGRELPALTIGSQSLRGFAAEQWTAYLDAAGYPRQSRLPATHPAAVAVPLGGSGASANRAADSAANGSSTVGTPPPRSDSPPPAASPGGIRF